MVAFQRWVTRAILAAFLVGGCASPTGSSGTSASAHPLPVTEATLGQVQAALQAQRDALVRRDLHGYQQTYDMERPAFRRCKAQTFEIAGRQLTAPAAPRIVKVEPYRARYVRAYVDEGERGVSRIYFKQLAGRWIETEPTSEDLGSEKTKSVDGVEIGYWGVDEDIIEMAARGALVARDRVLSNRLGGEIAFAIRFYPTRDAAGPGVDCNVVGLRLTADKTIRFYRMWLDPSLRELSPTMISFVRHEWLHSAQEAFIPGILARLDWWLAEGWPDFVGEVRRGSYYAAPAISQATHAVCTTQVPTFKQMVDGPNEDVEPAEVIVRYYTFASTMVEFLFTRFGPAAYRDLVLEYRDLPDPRITYPKVLKVSPEQFYADWQTFAKRRYC